METQQTRTQYQIKSADKAFKACPACESRDLFRFEGEAICFCCDWNSAALTAELSKGWRTIQPKQTKSAPTYVPNGGILGGDLLQTDRVDGGMNNE